jgi:hypothetical protein
MRLPVLAALVMLPAHGAFAFTDSGDNVAELVLRSLVMPKTTLVAMAETTVRISPRTVQADYVFHNAGEAPVTSVVVFPLPDVEGPYVNFDAGDTSVDNFLGFAATMDGKAVKPRLQQRVYSAELDLTDRLTAAKVALNPLSEKAKADVQSLPAATIDEWLRLGLLVEDTSETAADGGKVYAPAWTLKSTLSWSATFPPGMDMKISTSHANSLGSSVGFGLSSDAGTDDPGVKSLTEKYCVDASIIAAAKATQDNGSAYNASWSTYRLKAGSDWSPGIGTFTLIIEPSSDAGLASACGPEGEHAGPGSAVVFKDYGPDKDIDVLFLDPAESP